MLRKESEEKSSEDVPKLKIWELDFRNNSDIYFGGTFNHFMKNEVVFSEGLSGCAGPKYFKTRSWLLEKLIMHEIGVIKNNKKLQIGRDDHIVSSTRKNYAANLPKPASRDRAKAGKKKKLKIGKVSFIVRQTDTSDETTYFIKVSNVSGIHGSEAEMHVIDFQQLRGEIESKILTLEDPYYFGYKVDEEMPVLNDDGDDCIQEKVVFVAIQTQEDLQQALRILFDPYTADGGLELLVKQGKFYSSLPALKHCSANNL
jgi:hypothetical protein